MTANEMAQIVGIEKKLMELSDKLRAMTCGNPAIHCDQFILARGQINSAVRYIELGILKSGGSPGSAPDFAAIA